MSRFNIFRFICLLVMIIAMTIGQIKAQNPDTLWLQKIDLSRVIQSWDYPKVNASMNDKPLTIAGQTFKYGLGTHSVGLIKIDLKGKAQRFQAFVGLDDDATGHNGSVLFSVLADQKEVFRSPVMVFGTKAIQVDVNLKGVKQLSLIIEDGGDGISYDHADWAEAFILYKGIKPLAVGGNPKDIHYILTPLESPKPRINVAKIFGVRPGHPFMFTIAASGKRPMTFTAENLPQGLSLDPKTGIITGVLKAKGESIVTLKAINKLGTAARKLKIVVGDQIALTPPLGWNSWNCFGDSINQDKIKAVADAMVSSGLINHGWTYINLDEGWSTHPASDNPKLIGEPRNANGMININKYFTDMKGLTDYIHSKGLKAGLYSSPGTTTCSGYNASYQFEEKDAQQWADWGFDYIKYDWCSYGKISKGETIEENIKPYNVLRNALNKVDRDIVYSICWGGGKSWEWAERAGGNSWRTTDDIRDTWVSMAGIGFSQAGMEKYAGPGHWNDPDMLVVGLVGWGPQHHPSRLTADEQYTHISLWSLLASPLLIGCDMTRLDDFTINLLTNDEVIEINQDPLGKQASCISKEGGLEIWVKELEDGSKAVGLFNRNTSNETIKATWSTLGLKGKQIIRDVWRQKDQGNFTDSYSVIVPAHGVKLITIRKAK